MTNSELHYEKLIEDLIDYLKSTNKIFKENSIIKSDKKKQVLLRCRFCGDSRKNSNKTHLYLSFMNDKSILYHCFRCNNSGRLSKKFLVQYGFPKSDIIEFFNKYKKYLSQNQNFLLDNNESNKNSFSSKLVIYKNYDDFRNKLIYLYRRTGIDFRTIETQNKYKLVLSIKDFLKYNKINLSFTEDDNYIGFLNYSKNLIICRNINNSRIRYKNFPLLISPNSIKTIYTIKKEIMMEEEKPIFIVAEGIFDIINLEKKNKFDFNHVYISSNGKTNIVNSIKHMIKISGFYNAELRIFIDNDVDKKFIIKQLKKLPNQFNIFINKKNNDFGNKQNKFYLEKM